MAVEHVHGVPELPHQAADSGRGPARHRARGERHLPFLLSRLQAVGRCRRYIAARHLLSLPVRVRVVDHVHQQGGYVSVWEPVPPPTSGVTPVDREEVTEEDGRVTRVFQSARGVRFVRITEPSGFVYWLQEVVQ